ncbi:MAG: MetQ/NlpA family ABC transporter substrate-binding protein [Pygmaiobacter sp.]
MKHTVKLTALALSLALALTACGSGASSAPAVSSAPSSGAASSAAAITIKVGASPTPHAEILEQIKPLLAEQGINLEIVQFDDYVMPNTALDAGDLDANYFQHKPYLDDFNAKKGTEIVSLGGIHFEPLGIYAGKTASIEALADGAVIGIPSDNTNGARALQLLAAQGLFTIDKDAGLNATELDIVENPHGYKIQALEAAQLPASLPDLDLAVINGNYAVGAAIGDKCLVTEEKTSEAAQTYANILCVHAGDEQRPELVALLNALRSETVAAFINETYDGVVVPTF